MIEVRLPDGRLCRLERETPGIRVAGGAGGADGSMPTNWSEKVQCFIDGETEPRVLEMLEGWDAGARVSNLGAEVARRLQLG